MAKHEIRTEVVTDTDKATDDLEEFTDKVEYIEGKHVRLPIEPLDTSQQEGELERVERAADAAGDEVADLGTKSDQSGSVMANMVGNSAQDLGELGGVAGTAGVAVGQLAEYAADGNIQMSSLASTLGPMVALGVATKVIGDHFKKVAEAKAFRAEQIAGWVEAMGDGVDASEAMLTNFRELGKVEVSLGGDDTGDITRSLADLNLTVEDFTELTGMSRAELEAWSRAQAQAGADTGALSVVVMGAAATAGQLSAAERDAAAKTEVFADASDRAARKTEELKASYERLQDRLDDESAYLNAAQGFDDVKAAADAAYFAAIIGSADAEQAARDHRLAVLDLEGQVSDYVAEVDAVPGTAETILALIDNGQLAEAEARLAALEQQRTVTVNVAKGAGWAGIVDSPIWGGGAFGRGTTNVTINAPRGMRGDDLMAAAGRFTRRNGGRLG